MNTSANFPLAVPLGRDDISDGDRFPALAILGYESGAVELLTASTVGDPMTLPLALFGEFGDFGERLPQVLPPGWAFWAGDALFRTNSNHLLSLFVGYPELLENGSFLMELSTPTTEFDQALQRARENE